LIPLLKELQEADHGETEISGFVSGLVGLHGGSWVQAQDCWEQVVVKVLQTEVVPLNAPMDEATSLAVPASVIFLMQPDWADRCPVCRVRRAPASGGGDGTDD
jgi:hypothetical protein